MNNDDLSKILENSNITEEQKQAMLAILNNKKEPKKVEVKNNDNLSTSTQKENLTKIDRPIVDKDYIYKEIPCKKDLFKILYLADSNMILSKNSNMLGAFLIKWLNEGKIKYRFIKGNFFRPDNYVIELDPKLKFENEFEKEIYDFIKRAADGDNILTNAEFKRFCEKRKMEVQNLLDQICDDEERKAIEKKELKKEVKTYQEVTDDLNNPLNTNGIVKTIVNTTITNSKELNEDIKNIMGFKHYIKSLYKNKDVKLSNDYYVVCELLGITNYVADNFNEMYPEFYFRHLQYLHHLRSSFKPETAINKAIEIGNMQMK